VPRWSAPATVSGTDRLPPNSACPPGRSGSWLWRARGNAEALYRLGVQTVVALDPQLLPAQVRPTPLGDALEALAAAALAIVRRFGGEQADLWPVIAVLTGGRLLAPSPSP
jgi:hypothetical protein